VLFNHKKFLISEKHSIKDVISLINQNSGRVALVVDSENILVGIVTDGDIRRSILDQVSLNDSVTKIMSKNPITVTSSTPISVAQEIMRKNMIHHVPVIDDIGRVIKLLKIDDFLKQSKYSNPILIMAGGKGARLAPLTNNCPKPMLKINDKPTLEIILEKCIRSGFHNFYFSVYYLKEQIIRHFDNGDKWGVKINYLEETVPMGTCGSLSLLPKDIVEDVLLVNGDIITDLDLERLLKFHKKKKHMMTICTYTHRMKVPYAVVNSNNSKLESFVEKPTYDFQINAGIYALKPDLLNKIPSKFFNTTDLIGELIEKNEKVSVFPIHENWIDIGSPNDFSSPTQNYC